MSRRAPTPTSYTPPTEARYSLAGSPGERVQVQLDKRPLVDIKGVATHGIWQRYFGLLNVDHLRADAFIEGLVLGGALSTDRCMAREIESWLRDGLVDTAPQGAAGDVVADHHEINPEDE